ncbi:MAG: SRPBCC domain-containing protein [Proteobacteria bacterium]|nr:SRPBCC domain-containing protein [Pseudomonadota bacterium]
MGIEISTLHVRRSSLIQATPERVWREFTSFDQLAAWFGLGQQLEVYEPEVGGRVLLSVEIGGAKRRYGGPILIFEPARELTFSNNWESDGWPVPTLLTLRLTPLYDACHVELFHHGFERLGSSAGSDLQGYESGWDSHHLEALKTIVEG